jgi:hypothetical protein
MQRRLDNYDTLIDLTARWSDVYQQQSGDYLRKLRGKVRRNRMEPTEDDLLSTVQEWIEEIQDARDDRKNSIIKLFILQRASDKTSPQFMAWLSLINTA